MCGRLALDRPHLAVGRGRRKSGRRRGPAAGGTGRPPCPLPTPTDQSLRTSSCCLDLDQFRGLLRVLVVVHRKEFADGLTGTSPEGIRAATRGGAACGAWLNRPRSTVAAGWRLEVLELVAAACAASARRDPGLPRRARRPPGPRLPPLGEEDIAARDGIGRDIGRHRRLQHGQGLLRPCPGPPDPRETQRCDAAACHRRDRHRQHPAQLLLGRGEVALFTARRARCRAANWA
jgi:hypothetical protein